MEPINFEYFHKGLIAGDKSINRFLSTSKNMTPHDVEMYMTLNLNDIKNSKLIPFDKEHSFVLGFKKGFLNVYKEKYHQLELANLPTPGELGEVNDIDYDKLKLFFDNPNDENLDETPLDLSIYDEVDVVEPLAKKSKMKKGGKSKKRKSKKAKHVNNKKARRSRKQKK